MFPLPRLFTIRRLGGIFLCLAIAAAPAFAWAEVRQIRGVLSPGTRWETPYHVQQSDQPGPTVVIVGGIHGDEPAGAEAADQIQHWPIRCGTLAVLPRANPPALAARTRMIPDVEQSRGNLNRNFPRAGRQESARGEPAEAIWAWVQSWKPDWLVDLHEGGGIRAAGSSSVGSSVIVVPSAEAEAAVTRMLHAVNASIRDEQKRFVRLKPPIDGSLARGAGENLGAAAMILETSIHDLTTAANPDQTVGKGKQKAKASSAPNQPLSRRVRQQRLMVQALLTHLELLDQDLDADRLAGHQAEPDKTWVALYDAGGTGGKGESAVGKILTEAGMRVRHVGAEELAAGTLADFDLTIFPGGSGSKQAAAIGQQGRRQLQAFVERGGGYLGICAGAYLCTSGFDWGLNILDAKTVSPKWQRGQGTVKIELTPEGRKILGDRPGRIDVRYANGPIIGPAQRDDLADYQVLAFFRTELAEHGTPVGLMTNSPAIASGRCGQGRVVFISPHPEQTKGLEDLVRQAARWAVDKN